MVDVVAHLAILGLGFSSTWRFIDCRLVHCDDLYKRRRRARRALHFLFNGNQSIAILFSCQVSQRWEREVEPLNEHAFRYRQVI